MLFDFMNKTIKQYINSCHCGTIIGDRGTGKSTLMSLIADEGVKQGYNVYSNFPIVGVYALPNIVKPRRDGSKRVRLDKDFLYSTDLSNSVILIDEARTVWNARAYNDWTIQDEEFFNYIRKYNTSVWLATQSNDGIDLNCRRAVEYTFFLQKLKYFTGLLHNFSSVDISRSVQLKVADKNSQVVMRGYADGAYKVSWDIGELPCAFTHFYLKSYYGKFNSYYTPIEKLVKEPIKWESVLNLDTTGEEV